MCLQKNEPHKKFPATRYIHTHAQGGQGDLETLKRGKCSGQMSKLMILSFIVMITGFTFATPFSLLLTIPAYTLADRVSTVSMLIKHMILRKKICIPVLFIMYLNVASDDLYQKIAQKLKMKYF